MLHREMMYSWKRKADIVKAVFTYATRAALLKVKSKNKLSFFWKEGVRQGWEGDENFSKKKVKNTEIVGEWINDWILYH